MNHATQEFVRPGHETPPIPDFPDAPGDWTQSDAIALAASENLTLTEDHWRVVQALQEFHARQEEPVINMRELHDALDEDFHREGGILYLHTLFPNGPVAQGLPAGRLDAAHRRTGPRLRQRDVTTGSCSPGRAEKPAPSAGCTISAHTTSPLAHTNAVREFNLVPYGGRRLSAFPPYAGSLLRAISHAAKGISYAGKETSDIGGVAITPKLKRPNKGDKSCLVMGM